MAVPCLPCRACLDVTYALTLGTPKNAVRTYQIANYFHEVLIFVQQFSRTNIHFLHDITIGMIDSAPKVETQTTSAKCFSMA